MKQGNIDILLEKYFEGDTSLEEERSLRSYFAQANVSDEHKVYQSIFGYFAYEKNILEEDKVLPKRKISFFRWQYVAAFVVGISLFIGVLAYSGSYNPSKSMAYIDGKEISDRGMMHTQILNSLASIEELEENIIDSQIDILNLFAE